MKTMTLAEFHAALKAQPDVTKKEEIRAICPICEKVQTAQDLIDAGAGKTFDEVEQYFMFSCVGRWTGAGEFKKSKGNAKGCNWTLGGFLRLHKLEVITPDGKHHPRFELAT